MRHRRCPAPASRTGGTCTSKRDCGGAGGTRACSRSRLRLPELHLRRRHVPQPPRRSPDVTGSKSPRRGIHRRRRAAGPSRQDVRAASRATRPDPGRRRSGLAGFERRSPGQFLPHDPPYSVLGPLRAFQRFEAPPDQFPQRHTRSGSRIHPLSQVCREVDACPLVTACHTANVPQGCTAGKRGALVPAATLRALGRQHQADQRRRVLPALARAVIARGIEGLDRPFRVRVGV